MLPPNEKPANYEELGRAIGELVARKQREYGHASAVVAKMLECLYPDGVPTHAYADALLIVRTMDKLCRIATRDNSRKDKGGESPWNDVAGYALIGLKQDGETK
jgi:hypothetical protein